MMTSVDIKKAVGFWPLSALIVLTASMAAVTALVTAEARKLGAVDRGSRVVLEGFGADGRPVRVNVAGHHCQLVRYASDKCTFSRNDEPMFRKLEDRTLSLQCDSVMLSPTVADFPCNGRSCRHVHLNFPTVQTAASLRLTDTPTTLILDEAGVVSWSHRGMLSDSDLNEAVRAVQALK